MPLTAGTRLGPYEIIAAIGAGGMGEVWLAEDTRLDRRVAIKVLPPDATRNPERVRRFVQEAKAASALNHPNIITVYDIGESDAGRFIVMELVTGRTLRTVIAEKSKRAMLPLCSQIAKALSAAHAAGITHRDLKPENIMVRDDSYVKVLDFGLARLAPENLGDENATAAMQTMPGQVVGTVKYMSPEQGRGETISHPSDVFSLGVIFYELLARQYPFKAETMVGYLHAITTQTPPPLPQTPLNALILRMLEKRPAKRPTASEVAQALEELDRPEPSSTPRNQQKEIKRRMPSASTSSANETGAVGNVGKSKRAVTVMLALLLIAALGAGHWFFNLGSSRSTKAIESLAVLPFQNRSADADAEYLSDGLSESLIYRLSQLPNLKVSPTSSVFRYKGKATDPIKIGNELGVKAVMLGRMVQRGESLAISVELVDVRNNKTLWGQQYNRKLADLLVTQQEIASEIVQNLKLKISGDDQKGLTKRYTENNEAYQDYLKGRFFYEKGDVLSGVEYFQQAIKLDGKFAQAYVGLSDSYSSMPSRPILSPNEALPKAKAAAQRALEIDPALAEAHAALATSITLYDWNWTEAERQYRRALELNPNVAEIHYRYGMYHFLPMGRTGEAEAEFTQALALEPLSLSIGANFAGVYMYARQYERALEQAQRTDKLEPNHPVVALWLGNIYNINGMFTEAISLSKKSLQADRSNQLWLGIAGYAYAKTGRRREAEEILQRLQGIAQTKYVIPFVPAAIYAALGESDQAFAQLEKGFAARDIYLLYLKVDPLMDPLRGDARFAAMVKRLGMPQ